MLCNEIADSSACHLTYVKIYLGNYKNIFSTFEHPFLQFDLDSLAHRLLCAVDRGSIHHSISRIYSLLNTALDLLRIRLKKNTSINS